jgi:hypothetical protein
VVSGTVNTALLICSSLNYTVMSIRGVRLQECSSSQRCEDVSGLQICEFTICKTIIIIVNVLAVGKLTVMADAMIGSTCWRCLRGSVYTFVVRTLDDNETSPRYAALCKRCIRILWHARALRDDLSARDELTIRYARLESVMILRHGETFEILRVETCAFQLWLEEAFFDPICTLCGVYGGHYLYDGPSPFPLFAACRSCIKEVALANQKMEISEHHPFDHVVVRTNEKYFERLFFGEDRLVLWLVALDDWVRTMQPCFSVR